MSITTIPDNIFKRIMTCVGYPVLSLSDLTDGDSLDEDAIETLLIYPAMEQYFTMFPKKVNIETSVSGSFEVDFPSDNTFGLLDSRLIMQGNDVISSSNPFIAERYYRTGINDSGGAYGTNNHYNLQIVRMDEATVRQTNAEMRKAFKVTIDRVNRKVTGFTNISGRVLLVFAEYSTDWNDVLFRDQKDLIKLAQANVLEFFGALRNQSASNFPEDLTGDDFLSRARDYREQVEDKWNKRTKVVVLRG